MKFRKKPIVIEAERWDPELPFRMDEVEVEGIKVPIKKWDLGVYEDITVNAINGTGFVIDTLEGTHQVTPGDYIITGIKGEKYPCKPDILEMTYEPVTDEDTT